MKNIYIVKDKKSFINSLPPLTNAKVMTLKELEDKILGNYGNEARTYLYFEKNIPLNLIDVYLDTFKYLNGIDLNDKIKELNDLKKDLIEKNLYFYDDIFINSLKNVKITFNDCIKNKHLEKVIDYLKNKCEVDVNYIDIPKPTFIAHEYRSLEEEIDDVIYRVLDLINKGVDINHIKLMNVNNEYYPTLNRILNQYNLPHINLYDANYNTSNYVINFIKDLKTLGVKESIKLLNNKNYDLKILDIINSYAYLGEDIEKAKDFIIKDLKQAHIKKTLKDSYLELVDTSYKIKDNDYIFFVNFNNGNAPVIHDDSDYLTDDEYNKLGELNSSLKTNLDELNLLVILNKCFFVSYKLISLSNKHIPSFMVSKYNIPVNVETTNNHITRDKCYYSKDVEKFNYALSRDHYLKTKEKTKKYQCLAYNFKNDLKTKDYNFTGINVDKLANKLHNKFSLSYSYINTYYKCKFSYYLNNILGLNKFENTLKTIRGNVFHKLLEECEKEDFDYDRVFEEAISSFKETDNKIRFFSSLIKDEFYLVKEYNEALNSSSKLNNILHEYKIEFHELVKDYDVRINGTIDKVMYNDDSISLIDYKSGGSAKFKLDNLYYGFDLQLPMYAYFIKNDSLFKDKNLAGLYLQYVYSSYNDKELENKEECVKKYRLAGYSNEALKDVISSDPKTYISGKSDYSSLVMNNIGDYTKKVIDDGINGIIDGDFEINPAILNDDPKNSSCKYCDYKDICYFNNKKKEMRNLKTFNPEIFLGKPSEEDILVACIDIMNHSKEIKEKVEEIINTSEQVNNDLKELLFSFAPLSEDVNRLLKLIKNGKESE